MDPKQQMFAAMKLTIPELGLVVLPRREPQIW